MMQRPRVLRGPDSVVFLWREVRKDHALEGESRFWEVSYVHSTMSPRSFYFGHIGENRPIMGFSMSNDNPFSVASSWSFEITRYFLSDEEISLKCTISRNKLLYKKKMESVQVKHVKKKKNLNAWLLCTHNIMIGYACANSMHSFSASLHSQYYDRLHLCKLNA